MAETIKSALLIDYESVHRSLANVEGGADARLAERAAAWIAAIETGRLIGPKGTARKIVGRRCYAGSSVLGRHRNALVAAGFTIVDVAAHDPSRSSVDIQIAIDTIDALAQPAGPDEFIILSASAEMAPLLTRLKASKRSAAIYTDPTTSSADKALADAILERTLFAEFIVSEEFPGFEEKNPRLSADRAEIEAFARKVHAATNIPLFSPRTFSELFRHLTDEIRANGYHFQQTAKNVADRMTEAGRQVTRRQVVFIVKGLALKGHVFSTTDTPEVLAEVFREQARYLITNAGMTIDEDQDRLLAAWFQSRPAVIAPPAPAKTSAARTNGATPAPQTTIKPALGERTSTIPRTLEEKPPAAALIADKPAAPAKPVPAVAKPAEPAKVPPKPAPKSPASPVPSQPVAKAPPSAAAREEAKAVIAARIAASAKLKPDAKAAAKQPAKTPPPASKPAAARKPAADPAPDALLESSILAAIAEAVDVLVDDNRQEEGIAEPPAPAPRRKAEAPRDAEPETEGETASGDTGGDDSDIGDQIQRIIASYNRGRADE